MSVPKEEPQRSQRRGSQKGGGSERGESQRRNLKEGTPKKGAPKEGFPMKTGSPKGVCPWKASLLQGFGTQMAPAQCRRGVGEDSVVKAFRDVPLSFQNGSLGNTKPRQRTESKSFALRHHKSAHADGNDTAKFILGTNYISISTN